jgi:hypothetical protein
VDAMERATKGMFLLETLSIASHHHRRYRHHEDVGSEDWWEQLPLNGIIKAGSLARLLSESERAVARVLYAGKTLFWWRSDTQTQSQTARAAIRVRRGAERNEISDFIAHNNNIYIFHLSSYYCIGSCHNCNYSWLLHCCTNDVPLSCVYYYKIQNNVSCHGA